MTLKTLNSLYLSYCETDSEAEQFVIEVMYNVCVSNNLPVMARILKCAMKGYASTPRHLLMREIGRRLERGALA